ncbi:hypothetical protein QUB10_21970 [Microcoleus sp. B5-D4]|uniref:hypothetical protein n=1 Tax=unclassified Microcoleus TaxID=2642155 RepID=UPI002FD1F47F
MSRLDDIIELIQTTNEVYFITAPGRVRTAYILVDDILELALKTFLQEKTIERREQCREELVNDGIIASQAHHKALTRFFEDEIDSTELCSKLGRTSNPASVESCLNSHRDLNHWSANDPEARKEFQDVINEVKQEFLLSAGQTTSTVLTLLDEAFKRHRTRNKFYHDHHQAGLTINDEECLRALCNMFDLMEYVFPNIADEIKKNHTVRCQIGVLRLKQTASLGHRELSQPYEAALKLLKKGHKYDFERRSVEHSLVHTVSDRFFDSLREQFKNTIAKLQVRVNKIDTMARPKQDHIDEKNDKEKLIQILQKQLDQINALLGTP